MQDSNGHFNFQHFSCYSETFEPYTETMFFDEIPTNFYNTTEVKSITNAGDGGFVPVIEEQASQSSQAVNTNVSNNKFSQISICEQIEYSVPVVNHDASWHDFQDSKLKKPDDILYYIFLDHSYCKVQSDHSSVQQLWHTANMEVNESDQIVPSFQSPVMLNEENELLLQYNHRVPQPYTDDTRERQLSSCYEHSIQQLYSDDDERLPSSLYDSTGCKLYIEE